MYSLLKTPFLLLLSALLWQAKAADETAIVNEGKINVRGQPALIGEVVTQLQRGDQVTVLEYLPNPRPKPGEPSNWAKIKLPANTPVWVYNEMLRNGAVSATRLNLRAGPGDNYSVIGRLSRGDKVNVIRTMGDWAEIEAPAGAYAFVDASLIKSSAPTQTAATIMPQASESRRETSPAPTTAATAPPAETAPAADETRVASAPPIQDALAAPTQNRQVEQPTAAVPPPAPAVTASTTVSPPPPATQVSQSTAQPSSNSETTRSRRVVRREGIVRPTVSIQAPTWYELVHPETKKTIDYLHEEKLGVNLKQYKGQKVTVSGEELIDPRWPKTPILEIETLEMAP